MIYDWDEKFVHLLNKKTSLRQMYSQVGLSITLSSSLLILIPFLPTKVPDLDPEYIALLEQSQTETEVCCFGAV